MEFDELFDAFAPAITFISFEIPVLYHSRRNQMLFVIMTIATVIPVKKEISNDMGKDIYSWIQNRRLTAIFFLNTHQEILIVTPCPLLLYIFD